jgi:CheY-like chemotaxis protein
MNATSPGVGQCTALVIDDDESSLVLARMALEEIGIRNIVAAGDGAAGLRMLDGLSPAPDFVICDIFMPESDGIEMVNALVERHYAGGLVLITGGDSQYLVIAKRIARFHGLNLLASLTKPIGAAALRHALFGAADGHSS